MALLLAGVSALLSAAALWRAFIPPQSRDVAQLRLRIEDIEEDNRAVHDKLDRRARRENMATAREAAMTSKAERETLLEQALRVQAGAGAAPAAPPMVAADPEEERRQLRAQFLTH